MAPPRTEREIISSWQGCDEKPVLSICCITFNHAPFISMALESFLEQRTTFPFEIVVHDDASVDGTSDIIEEFSKRFPRIIRPILQNQNQYRSGVKPLSSFVFPQAVGKYLALCEGDDYWSDECKVQKQVEFLDNNPGYVICYHDSLVVDSHGKVLREKLPEASRRDFSETDLLYARGTIATQTAVLRHVVRSLPEEYSFVVNEDRFLFSFVGLYGKGKFLTNIEPSRYRRHEGGIWSEASDRKQVIKKIETYYWMAQFFHRKSRQELADYYFAKAAKLLLRGVAFKPSFYWHLISYLLRTLVKGK